MHVPPGAACPLPSRSGQPGPMACSRTEPGGLGGAVAGWASPPGILRAWLHLLVLYPLQAVISSPAPMSTGVSGEPALLVAECTKFSLWVV